MILSNPESSGILVKSVGGLGPVKATINQTDFSSSDGSYFNSARIGSRNIVLDLVFLAKPTIEYTRQMTYQIFPVKKQVTLLIETDERKVTTTGYVESNEPNIFSSLESSQISIICPDPYFHSLANSSVIFSGVDSLFEFPFPSKEGIEPLIEFGKMYNDYTKVITYNGDSEVGITMNIHVLDDVGSISIFNSETREAISVDSSKVETSTGKPISVADDITICTIPGKKSVILLREGITTNILNCIARNPSWFKLHRGDNIFTYSTDNNDDGITFKVEYNETYEGI